MKNVAALLLCAGCLTLCAGCAEYSEQELDEILDSHAIDLSVSAGTASLRIAVNCPKESLALTVKLLRAVLSAPLFPEKALERERTAILEELKVKQCSPDGLAEDLLTSTLFAGHPYGIPLAETIRNITAVKASAIRSLSRSAARRSGLSRLAAGISAVRVAPRESLRPPPGSQFSAAGVTAPPRQYGRPPATGESPASSLRRASPARDSTAYRPAP